MTLKFCTRATIKMIALFKSMVDSTMDLKSAIMDYASQLWSPHLLKSSTREGPTLIYNAHRRDAYYVL